MYIYIYIHIHIYIYIYIYIYITKAPPEPSGAARAAQSAYIRAVSGAPAPEYGFDENMY